MHGLIQSEIFCRSLDESNLAQLSLDELSQIEKELDCALKQTTSKKVRCNFCSHMHYYPHKNLSHHLNKTLRTWINMIT